jgi:hypothetical protein
MYIHTYVAKVCVVCADGSRCNARPIQRECPGLWMTGSMLRGTVCPKHLQVVVNFSRFLSCSCGVVWQDSSEPEVEVDVSTYHTLQVAFTSHPRYVCTVPPAISTLSNAKKRVCCTCLVAALVAVCPSIPAVRPSLNTALPSIHPSIHPPISPHLDTSISNPAAMAAPLRRRRVTLGGQTNASVYVIFLSLKHTP